MKDVFGEDQRKRRIFNKQQKKLIGNKLKFDSVVVKPATGTVANPATANTINKTNVGPLISKNRE